MNNQDRRSHRPPVLPMGDRWYPPPSDETEEYKWESPLPEGDLLKVRFEQDYRDRLTLFAVMHMSLWRGRLREVVRIDTCHEEVHIHQLATSGKEIKRTPIRIIRSQQDVEDGYEQALDLIEQKWEEHKRRWRCGR